MAEIPNMRSNAEIFTQMMLENIAYYRKCPEVGAQYAVQVLEGILTRGEQEMVNEHRCRECHAPAQWVLTPHICRQGRKSDADTDRD